MLPGRGDFGDGTGHRVVSRPLLDIARTRGAKRIAELGAAALARIERVGIVRVFLGFLEIELVEGNVSIRFVAHESQHDVQEHPNALFVTGADQGGQILIGRRRQVAFGIPQFVIGGQVVRRSVTPLAGENAVGGRQQLHGIDAKLNEIRRDEACHRQL